MNLHSKHPQNIRYDYALSYYCSLIKENSKSSADLHYNIWRETKHIQRHRQSEVTFDDLFS